MCLLLLIEIFSKDTFVLELELPDLREIVQIYFLHGIKKCYPFTACIPDLTPRRTIQGQLIKYGIGC